MNQTATSTGTIVQPFAHTDDVISGTFVYAFWWMVALAAIVSLFIALTETT